MDDLGRWELLSSLHDRMGEVFPPLTAKLLKELEQERDLTGRTLKRVPLAVVRRHLHADGTDASLRERVWRRASPSEALTLLHACYRGLWLVSGPSPPEAVCRRLASDRTLIALALVGLESLEQTPPRRGALVRDEFPHDDGRLIPGPSTGPARRG